METEESEDAVVHAAKLLEVIILQCRGQIDQVGVKIDPAIFSRRPLCTHRVDVGDQIYCFVWKTCITCLYR